jgi:Leucine-rich repeat (LRR) protein
MIKSLRKEVRMAEAGGRNQPDEKSTELRSDSLEADLSGLKVLDLSNQTVKLDGPTLIKEIAESAPGLKKLVLPNFRGQETINFDFTNALEKYLPELESITFPNGTIKINRWAGFIGNSSLREVKFPSTLKEIDGPVFSWCENLQSIDLGETKLDAIFGLFSYCKNLRNVKLPATLACIGDNTFSKCTSLKSIDLSGTKLEIICPSAFAGSGLERIVVPSSVESIQQGAFLGCPELKNVDLSNATKVRIESLAFAQCPKLAEVKLPPNVRLKRGPYDYQSPYFASSAFRGYRDTLDIQVGDAPFRERVSVQGEIVACGSMSPTVPIYGAVNLLTGDVKHPNSTEQLTSNNKGTRPLPAPV